MFGVKKNQQMNEKVVYEFECSDNGIGMSQEFIPHACEMFSQENITSRSKL